LRFHFLLLDCHTNCLSSHANEHVDCHRTRSALRSAAETGSERMNVARKSRRLICHFSHFGVALFIYFLSIWVESTQITFFAVVQLEALLALLARFSELGSTSVHTLVHFHFTAHRQHLRRSIEMRVERRRQALAAPGTFCFTCWNVSQSLFTRKHSHTSGRLKTSFRPSFFVRAFRRHFRCALLNY
jgi:hypothetical protein